MNQEPIQALISETIGESLATHYIMIIEVMTDVGMDLRIATSDNLTAWHATGMMEVAKDIIMDSRYISDDDDEEES